MEVWIIEARDADGNLDLKKAPQPEEFFGMGAITGMTDNRIAQAIFRTLPDAVLTGDSIPAWPALIDPRFRARRKTW